MTVWLLWVGAALVAAVVTAEATRGIIARAPLRRRNHRGLEIPTAVGIAVMLGILAGLGLVAIVRAITGTSSARMVDNALVTLPAIAAVLGFGLFGLWDDLAGEGHGWGTHVRALARRRPTGGAVKLVGGVLLALILVAPRHASLWWTFGDAAILAMSANLFNLLDARPGRASKVFLLAAVPMLAIGGAAGPLMGAGIGAVIAFLPFDLRERAMLGDAGANSVGALIGVGILVAGSDLARLLALGSLIVLHLVGERPGLSRAIGAAKPLRAFDEAGRVAG